MKHLNTYKIFEAWWSKKEPKKETFSLESDEGKKVWDVEKFNNWFKNDYSGYDGYPGGAAGIFRRTNKLSIGMISDYFEEMNIVNLLIPELYEFRDLIIDNWLNLRKQNEAYWDKKDPDFSDNRDYRMRTKNIIDLLYSWWFNKYPDLNINSINVAGDVFNFHPFFSKKAKELGAEIRVNFNIPMNNKKYYDLIIDFTNEGEYKKTDKTTKDSTKLLVPYSDEIWDIIKTHMYDGMNESSTEFSDHNAGMNNIINTQGSNQITLPTDYYDFDMEEDEDELPNRTGRDDKSIPHQNKYKKTPYKMSAENLNVQDIMTYPTFILKDKLSILNSFYNQIKETQGIKKLTDITSENIEEYVGFSFIYHYNKLYILSDSEENMFLLLDKELIPINNSDNIMKIIDNEL